MARTNGTTTGTTTAPPARLAAGFGQSYDDEGVFAQALVLLREPFPAYDVEWRLQSKDKATPPAWGLALAYITARGLQERFDAVCGPGNWRPSYTTLATGAIMCSVWLRVKAIGWVEKSDGAGQSAGGGEKGLSDADAKKSGFSNAFKRAAVVWGPGRYLYNLEAGFVRPCPKDTPGARADGGGPGRWYWAPPRLPLWALPGGSGDPDRAPDYTPRIVPHDDDGGGDDGAAAGAGAEGNGEAAEHAAAPSAASPTRPRASSATVAAAREVLAGAEQAAGATTASAADALPLDTEPGNVAGVVAQLRVLVEHPKVTDEQRASVAAEVRKHAGNTDANRRRLLQVRDRLHTVLETAGAFPAKQAAAKQVAAKAASPATAKAVAAKAKFEAAVDAPDDDSGDDDDYPTEVPYKAKGLDEVMVPIVVSDDDPPRPIPTECPWCGGALFDNRAENDARAAAGKTRSPDWRCRTDRAHVIWHLSRELLAAAAGGARVGD